MAQFCYGWLTEDGTTLHVSVDRYNPDKAPRFYFADAPSFSVVAPERWGTWETAKAFKTWAQRFADDSPLLSALLTTRR